ncbi:MAG TPA: M15 family metallopeptidase, partial [Mycobacterium sp.]
VYTPPGLQQNDSQDPSTFGWVHGGPLEPLVWQGHNFGQVATGTAKLWTALLNELVPLIPGGLTSDLGCFDDRANVNNPAVLSFHAYGLACDLNTGVNGNGSTPQSLQGRQFALPMVTHDVVAKYCAQWGGDFRGVPDPMHVEIHCTPAQIAAWSATQP